MAYKFKEKITLSDYKEFLLEYNYLSFMQEHLWAKAKQAKEYKVVGVYDEDKLCAVSLLIIEKINRSKKIVVPNGYLMDLTNYELLEFFTNSIKNYAKKHKIFCVEVYPYISNKDRNSTVIDNNFNKLGYVHNEDYLDYTRNLIIKLTNNNIFLSDQEIENKFGNLESYVKKGISFEITNEFIDIDRLNDLNKENLNIQLIKNLILYYKNRVKMIFAKFDLAFYKEYLEDNDGSKEEINKINNIIYSIGDEIDVACALIILPRNEYGTNICELMFNSVNESFEKLDLENAIFIKVLEILKEENIDYLKITNNNLELINYVNRYNAIAYKYIGCYTLVINKLKYYFYYDVKRR